MNIKRNATALWKGTGKEGKGWLTTPSGVFEATPYAFNTRFENAKGTNPEELMAAAHAGCFAMKLSFVLTEAGFTATSLDTTCTITMENGVINHSQLVLKATIPGISEAAFKKATDEAKQNCPVSKAYNFPTSLEASLIP